jgi:hypothetical protein
LGHTGALPLQPIDDAAWIWHPECGKVARAAHADFFATVWQQPGLLRFRKSFEAAASPLRLHVTGDERFELLLDGQRIARGPLDRSDVEHWCYATYDLKLNAGAHKLEALV